MAHTAPIPVHTSVSSDERVIILVSCRACGAAFERPRVVRSGNEGRCRGCEETAATFRTNIGEIETQV
ncbi:MAG: hypothetical protein KC657_01185 [Myxococcales bacterium]|nr:hypothetical protein [Myxococcales bacterium]